MTDEPTTAQDVITMILLACPSRHSVLVARDLALGSGRYTGEELRLIMQAAETRLLTLGGR